MKPFPTNIKPTGIGATPRTLSGDVRRVYDALNGGIEAEQVPVKSIDDTKLAHPTRTDLLVSPASGWRIDAPLQSWAQVHQEGPDPWTPVDTIDMSADTWGTGWNFLDAYLSNFRLETDFEAEGVLVGAAVIDWHRGVQRYNTGGFVKWWGVHWYMQWAVFVNGVRVVTSDKLPPQRHTTQLSWAVPSPGGKVLVQAAFRTISDWDPATPGVDTSTDLDIFGARLWVRHAAR